MSDNDRENLELRLAYLERTAEELGDIVYRQQREIEDLRERLARAERSLVARADGQGASNTGDERPPHY